MVQLALDERERMRVGPRRTPAEYVRTVDWDVAEPIPVDYWMVWRHVLHGGGVPDRLRPAVLAYFGCLHGTGCVERGLGRDKRAVVEPHVGSLRPSPEIEEDSSKCLELHRDGPRREQHLFVRSAEGDVLLLTVFRELAQCSGWRRAGVGSVRARRSGRTASQPIANWVSTRT